MAERTPIGRGDTVYWQKGDMVTHGYVVSVSDFDPDLEDEEQDPLLTVLESSTRATRSVFTSEVLRSSRSGPQS